MQRFYQLLFVFSLVGLCWLAMMTVHELGHVLGAFITGGSVTSVVLHPLAISRSNVSPNPHPGIVVWLGPMVGGLLPFFFATITPRRYSLLRNITKFFAGFCLVANGAYIAIGSLEGIGDCGEMLRSGTPVWVMIAFGALTVPAGLYQWHRLGPLRNFFDDNNSTITQSVATTFLGILATAALIGLAFSPR